MQAKRKDTDATQCSDGLAGPVTMNQYGYLHVDKNNEIKSNLDDIKTKLDTIEARVDSILTILEDIYDSTSHSMKVTGI